MILQKVSRKFVNLTWLLVVALAASVVWAWPNDNQEGEVETRTFQFRPGRSYEVTGIWLDPKHAPELNAYFGKVFPIAAQDYGVKPLFSLEPLSAYAGDFVPPILFVNEWPSLASFQGFISDPRARALFPERDAIVQRLIVSQYEVPQEVTVSLSEGDVVEFAAMWVKPGSEVALRSYYETALPIARRHGLRPLTPLKAVFSYKGDFLPSMSGLNLWGSLENFRAFVAEAKPLFPRRDAALERLEVTHAKVHFEGTR